MAAESRYRIEDGVPCIDVALDTVEQIFDNRDPAPFRERDLDPDLADYLLAAGEDLFTADQFRVVFWVAKPCPPVEIEDAFRAHFEDTIERIRRIRKRRRRAGQVALVLGVVLVVALLALGQFVGTAVGGTLGAGLKEGLTISCWVVMWRPIETLVYDWIPQRHERRVAERMLGAPVEVRGAATADVRRPGTGVERTSGARARPT
ncbi:MAG: hypothetical protein ABI678_00560 [Kofleriaceae bacterium]